MASLALAASIIVLFTLIIGPLTYLLAKLGTPQIIVYLLSIFSIFSGISFCTLAIPIWYIGLIPIYFGYISIQKTNSLKAEKLKKG